MTQFARRWLFWTILSIATCIVGSTVRGAFSDIAHWPMNRFLFTGAILFGVMPIVAFVLTGIEWAGNELKRRRQK